MKTVQDLKEISARLLDNCLSLLDKEHSTANKLQKEAFLIYSLQTLTQLGALLKENRNHQLNEFLAKNWAFINGTALSYTSLPNDELTILFCDIAQYIHDSSQEKNSCALKILMPSLAIDATDKISEIDIKKVLKTHILGREGKYLIPVERLIDLLKEPSVEWKNYFYDNSQHPEHMAWLSKQEYQRLAQHSPEAVALVNAHKQHELSINQQNGLLAHLKQLCQHLYFNSSKVIGKEESAGAGTYDAIIKFNEYYTKLDDVTKATIPKAVKDEIELLLKYASSKEDNINATRTIGTCIATRRECLTKAMESREETLSKIALSDSHKVALIKEKKNQLTNCETALINAIKQPNFYGHDALGLTSALMKALNLTFRISSIVDIQDLMKLSREEFAEIYKDETLQQQLVAQFFDLESFVIFVHETPLEKLKIILISSGRSLASTLIKTPGDILALLYTLNKEQCELICASMIVSRKIITSAKELESVLSPLSPEQRSLVCKIINVNPASIFKVSELTYYLESYFPDNVQKRKIQQCYFNGLLENILIQCATLHEAGFIASHDLGIKLVNNLKKASLGYFGDEKIKPSMNYDEFNQSCKEAINNADELRRYHSWGVFLIELTFCVASFGIIPLILSVTNKVTQGTWNFRLFNTVTAIEMNNVLAFSHETEEMMSAPLLS